MGAAATLAGVTLAVVAVVTVHLVGAALANSLTDLAGVAPGGHTHVATRDALVESDYFEARRLWRAGEVDGVEALVPAVDDFVRIGGQPFRLLGFDPMAFGFSSLRTGGATAYGDVAAFLTEDVVIAGPRAAQAIRGAGGVIGGYAVTLIEGGADDAMLADLPTAQRLLRREGELDAVWIRATSVHVRLRSWLAGLLPGIGAALPKYAAPVLPGFDVADRASWHPVSRFADASVFNLGMLTLLSLLMAGFLVVQASYSNFARRRRERERLLAIGVARARLTVLAVGEGALLGAVAAALGIAVGVAVAGAVLRAADADARLPTADAWVIGKAAFCAVFIGGLGPAVAEYARGRRSWLAPVVAIVATALAALSLAADSLAASFVALFAVCCVQIVGVVPLASAAVGAAAVRLSPRLSAKANARAAMRRAGEIKLALGALSIAAAAAIGMGLMVESLRGDFTAMLEQRLWPAVYLDGRNGAESGRDAFDAHWIGSLPNVRDVRRYGEFSARLSGHPVAVTVARLDVEEAARYGLAEASTDGVLLNEIGARSLGLNVGDVANLRASGASAPVEIVHVFRDFGAPMPRLVMPLSLGEKFERAVAWRRVVVRADGDAVGGLAARLGERYGSDQVRDHAAIRRFAMTVFDRSFAVSQALTVIALTVAAVGLYAALTGLQAGRQREFRLLSAVGYSRGEIWRQAMAQTAILGSVSALAALPLGVFIAWVLCAFVNPQAFGWSIGLTLDAWSIAGPLLLGVGAAVAAGAIPAYKSSFGSGGDE